VYAGKDYAEVLKTTGQFLLFRSVKPDMARHGSLYLAVGIGSAWLAGIGRYWDHPNASLWQMIGLGSVAYIFVLALVLYLLLWPLRPKNWSYPNILIFVGMTSPPALLYAIPVERFTSLDNAQTINVWFLAVVATWRVILLFLYLKRSGELGGGTIIVAGLLPIALTIVALTLLNLQHVVFKIMGGLREEERGPHDGEYGIMIMISILSVYGSPLLLMGYIGAIFSRWKEQNQPEDAHTFSKAGTDSGTDQEQ
jgi:hypothetical protein